MKSVRSFPAHHSKKGPPWRVPAFPKLGIKESFGGGFYWGEGSVHKVLSSSQVDSEGVREGWGAGTLHMGVCSGNGVNFIRFIRSPSPGG